MEGSLADTDKGSVDEVGADADAPVEIDNDVDAIKDAEVVDVVECVEDIKDVAWILFVE
jgi:hypothetical protein